MAKTKISEFNANPALNTDIDSINIAEGCAPSGINDAIRELMSQLKDWQSGTSNDPYVVGSSGSLTLNQGTANGVAYLNGSKVVTSGSALTFDGTNLGVGTSSAGGSKLTVQNSSILVRTDGDFLKVNDVADTTYWFRFTRSSSDLEISNRQAGAIKFLTSDAERARIDSSGNLGIGTSSPAGKLSVKTTGAQVDISTSATDLVFEAIDRTTTSNPIDTKFYTRNGTFQWYNGQYTERMRLDSSGNLGLGVTPSAWYSSSKAIDLGAGGAIQGRSNTAGTFELATNAYLNTSGSWTYKASSVAANLFAMSDGTYKWNTAASGTAGNAITFTQAMTLTASSELLVNRTSASGLGKLNVEGGADFTNGNVLIGRDSGNLGVGTTSPSRKLSVYSTSSIPVRFETNTSDTKIEILTTSGTQFIQGSANNLLFGTNNTEAARIDSSGNLLVGTTSALVANTALNVVGSFGAYFKATGGAGNEPLNTWNSASSGTIYQISFRDGASASIRGSVTTNGTSTAFNTSSDYRLKNSIAPMAGALAKVAQLKPCTYKWNSDGSDGEGFIAHELAEVVPQCVTGEKDAVDENGNPKYQGIDTSFLVATLTAAIQELKAEFDAYKASHP